MVARPPRAPDDFPTNLVLTVELVDDLDLRTWQRDVDATMPPYLRDYHLLDLQLTRIADHDGVRRLVSHTGDDGRALTLEQWAVIVRGTGYTVSATTATLEWPTQGPVLARVARTLAPLGRR